MQTIFYIFIYQKFSVHFCIRNLDFFIKYFIYFCTIFLYIFCKKNIFCTFRGKKYFILSIQKISCRFLYKKSFIYFCTIFLYPFLCKKNFYTFLHKTFFTHFSIYKKSSVDFCMKKP